MAAPKDRPRVNTRGDVWCFSCRQYLPSLRFRRHPSRPAWWSYCRDCTRAIDRQRTRCIPGTPEWRAATEGRVRRKRRQRARERRGRVFFVRDAILLLRRRGFTKTEVAKLAGVSLGSLLKWEGGETVPDPNVAERFVVVLRETGHLPAGPTPEARRRLPHPELPTLLARCGPLVAAFPVRSRWKEAA